MRQHFTIRSSETKKRGCLGNSNRKQEVKIDKYFEDINDTSFDNYVESDGCRMRLLLTMNRKGYKNNRFPFNPTPRSNTQMFISTVLFFFLTDDLYFNTTTLNKHPTSTEYGCKKYHTHLHDKKPQKIAQFQSKSLKIFTSRNHNLDWGRVWTLGKTAINGC